ncbi:cardiolipin synthase ClsB [Luteimonas sp. 8-5]|uniref:cardiolipin synthase ClsB n=1 Tax=Luteimonas sp. 8-5 TaxID=3039387 RepID=UPI0024371B02|nr:cardiolipin synthase ClsB [Luteimonas sp. 8-5]MDG6348529.1 cardiolipin synthase ClsB [Luteimonas sp. 8-5]
MARVDSHELRLLENGEAFFARVGEAIAAARDEVLLESFILFEDKVGLALQQQLVAAARRGVRVEATVDGYGSPHFSPGFIAALSDAGVRLRVFDPHRPLLGMRMHVFRRLHRKLLVIDGRRAFIGGINFSADHLADFGPDSKQDYAVEVAGPIAATVRDFMHAALSGDGTGERWHPPPAPRDAALRFVLRDNRNRSRDIEHAYRQAIRAAQEEVLLANAYFFPGYGFTRDLRHAARRGVRVVLLMQGQPDTPLARIARRLYRPLAESGVELHEYCRRPFHGKVAVVDREWATVGSSNLDPLSLSLNLESNLVVRDRDFAGELRARLLHLLEEDCEPVDQARMPPWRPWHVLTRPLLFHCLRRFPDWAGLLPAHTPKTALLRPDPGTTP